MPERLLDGPAVSSLMDKPSSRRVRENILRDQTPMPASGFPWGEAGERTNPFHRCGGFPYPHFISSNFQHRVSLGDRGRGGSLGRGCFLFKAVGFLRLFRLSACGSHDARYMARTRGRLGAGRSRSLPGDVSVFLRQPVSL